MLRARYRSPDSSPEPLRPDRVYRLEIDLWATANRFKAGLSLIHHDPDHPSHLLLCTARNHLVDVASQHELRGSYQK